MAIFFKGKYPEYYEQLKDTVSLESNKNTLTASMTEVDSEMAGITGLLTELEGSYSGEMAETFEALTTEVILTYQMVSEGLSNAISNMETLSTDLGDFKREDENLENKDGDLKKEENKSVTRYKTNDNNEQVETQEYKDWVARKQELSNTIEELKKAIKTLQNSCDDSIASIDEFNESVVNIRLKMATLAFAQDGYSLDDIQNMSPEEREQLIAKMIDAMTVKYNEYKAAYESFVKQMYDSENIRASFAMYQFLVEPDLKFPDGGTSVEIGFGFVDLFLKMSSPLIGEPPNEKSFIDIINAYTGPDSYESSGLAELFNLRQKTKYGYEDNSYEEFVEWFQAEVRDYYPDRTIEEWFKLSAEGAKELETLSESFKFNYQKTLEVGTAIQGLKELKGHAKYDGMIMDADFDDYEGMSNAELLASIEEYNRTHPKGQEIDADRLKYMSPTELKMYKYIMEHEGIEQAKAFSSSIGQTLTRREGYVRATEYYYYLKDGSNTGLEAVWDHLSAGGTGLGDGVRDFCDGLVDLVAPSKELSADEYAQLALISYLTEGDSGYDKSLLASYNIGSTVGKESIPFVVGLINPTAGKTIKVLSDTGNALEEYYRAEEGTSYWEALAHAGLDLAAGDGVESLLSMTGLDSTPLGKLAIAATKSVTSTCVDYMYDPEGYKPGENLVDALMGSMVGQLGDKVADDVGDMFGDYLKGQGWPKDYVDKAAKIFKPVAKTVGGATAEAGKEAIETSVENALTGGNEDPIKAGLQVFEDKVTGKALKTVRQSADAAGEIALENYRERHSIDTSDLF